MDSKEALRDLLYPEDSPPEHEVVDVIEHKFGQPRDAESDIRRRKRRR